MPVVAPSPATCAGSERTDVEDEEDEEVQGLARAAEAPALRWGLVRSLALSHSPY